MDFSVSFYWLVVIWSEFWDLVKCDERREKIVEIFLFNGGENVIDCCEFGIL